MKKKKITRNLCEASHGILLEVFQCAFRNTLQKSIFLPLPQHIPIQIHKKIPWQWDPAGVWYVGRQIWSCSQTEKFRHTSKKNVLTCILFHFHVLFCSLCGEVLVIKGPFYRLFNLFPLTCSIFKMRSSERQQKDKLFRDAQPSNPSNSSLCSQGKAQDTET